MARVFSMTALAAAALFTVGAHAATPAPLTATQMLQQFNLVVSNDLVSTSHVQGRTFVGRNATALDFVQKPLQVAASDYAGVTVLGDFKGNNGDAHIDALGLYVGGSTTRVIVNKGDAYVGGDATSGGFQGNAWIEGTADGANLNGAAYAGKVLNGNNNNKLTEMTSSMVTAKAAATSTDFGTVMTGLSTQLSSLQGSSSAKVSFDITHTKVTFSGAAVNGLMVFDLTKDDMDSAVFSSGITEFYFNITGASTVIFNTNDPTLSLNANFENAEANGSKFIWNFAGAESVTFGRTFGGQVLVADGTFSNMGGANVEGGVYAKNVNENGQIHIQSFTGTIPSAVPEPASYAMLLAGLGLMGMVSRRRKQ